ncbi:DUF4440 domain-containing protein [Mycobacteroides immunogenum]|uniref:DUF4440 domain-containing protein n=1 Tax=Mycobacteroides immunogenum TaxID=83262 RepID=A0A179V2U3_9MYCO|nr:nuclear transport factor 2 family protein [Mycobacteroides immunogenum]OAT66268.1 DUF4440 domain-containing protein [Mycobacteroides immunogenum]
MTSSASSDQSRAHILALEDARYQAVLNGDFEAFRHLCHPDLVYTHSDSVRDSLDSYLEKCTAGYYTYQWTEHPVDEVLIVGDTAVVVGRMRAGITVDGSPKELNNNCIAVWVRSGDSWLLLSFQPTPLRSGN